jgi:hypothetical protein
VAGPAVAGPACGDEDAGVGLRVPGFRLPAGFLRSAGLPPSADFLDRPFVGTRVAPPPAGSPAGAGSVAVGDASARVVLAFDAEVADRAATACRVPAEPSTTTVTPESARPFSTCEASVGVAAADSTVCAISAEVIRPPARVARAIRVLVSEGTSAPGWRASDTNDLPEAMAATAYEHDTPASWQRVAATRTGTRLEVEL